jgi:hypothetical protein
MLYDQLTMLAQCLPILLLCSQTLTTQAAKTKYVCRTCELFLSGSWRLLTTEAAREMRELAEHQTAPDIRTAQHHDNVTAQVALKKARRLQYSLVMNLLRSAGLATDDLQTVHDQLSALHPTKDLSNLFADATPPGRAPSRDTFDLITSPWLELQIKRSSAGTAVDQ